MIKSESLKKTRDFSVVYQKGKSIANRTLVLYVLRVKDRDTNRVGISVSKKVGNSVVRHHLTRLVRESYRLHENEFVGGIDLIVLVRPGAKESDFFTIERALLSLGRRAEITSSKIIRVQRYEKDHDMVHS